MFAARSGLPVYRWVMALVLVAGLGASAVLAQGRRIGLVIGLGEYGETPHPTAVSDAGLVAQSLKQAGFELTEAANLSQNEFRQTFREFADRAASAGPDAIVAVYIAGLALQDDGENILIPVGARIRQRSDLALEGLRLGDFLRGLNATPSAARIVMIDAAYSHPHYGQLVAESGRGLSVLDPISGTLVAYNQKPGAASALPQTNYGYFAMALAEALREPGLDLGAICERVRLRVHDLSQGIDTPWSVNGIAVPIVLNAAPAGGQGAPVPPEIAARSRPLADLSADEAYARAVQIDTIRAYEDFLRLHPSHAQAKRVRAMVAARREAYYWQRTRKANTERAYWTYLKRYPRGAHASEAESRLSRLSAPIVPPPAFEEVYYDDLAPPPVEEIEIYETIVIEERWEVLPPPTAYPLHFLPPPPVEIIDLPPPPPRDPMDRLLPAVAIGAGVVGAAILANRAWKRPAPVRPVVAPPIPRPPRPPEGWVGRRPVVLPPVAPPGTGGFMPRPPGTPAPVGVTPAPPGPTPPVAPPGTGGLAPRPPGIPAPVGVTPAPPGGQSPPPGAGAIRPGSAPPSVLPAPRPGAIQPAPSPLAPPPAAIAPRPVPPAPAPPPVVAPRPAPPPPVAAPRPAPAPPPVVAPRPAPPPPVAAPRPAPAPPPVAAPRPAPPPPVAAPRPAPAPPPVVAPRPAPPPPVAAPRPAPAPPPVAAPRPAPSGCTPQMRAARQC